MAASRSKSKNLENHALRRLAHLMAGGENQQTLDSAHDFLVEQTLLEHGKDKSLKDVQEGISSLFLLRFSNEEVKTSLDRLLRSGRVVEKASRYTLEVRRAGELRKINSETKAQEKNIYNAWLKSISLKYPELSDEDQKLLRKDLQDYLNKVFLQNGAECSILLYPEKKNPNLLAGMSPDEIAKILPTRSERLNEIRRIEFPVFLQDIDTEKQQYFSRLLDGTFIYNIVQADPSVIEALKEQLNNYVFYLDTNVIYALLELHSPKKASTVEKAFNIGRAFGINFVVSARTVEEMQKSVELKSKELLSTPEIRRDLAKESADISEEENFITSYLRSYSRTGITKEDFVAKFQHVPELLKERGVLIIQSEGEVSEKELEKEVAALRTVIPRKTVSIAEHDAYHKLLIEKERENAIAKVSGKKVWFFSFDTLLSQYALKNRQERDTPFVYMPHQLLQVLRIFEQRTPDYDATFVELFSRPQIKYAIGVLPNNLAQKILSKISGYADLPKEFAMKIMVNQKFVSAVSETSGAEQDELISKQVEHELTNSFNELTGRVEELEKQKIDLTQQKEKLAEDSSSTLGVKNREVENLKTILLVVSLVLLLLLGYVLHSNFWNNISLVPRLIALAISLISLLGVLKLKWNIGLAYSHIGTTLAIAALFWTLAFLGLPENNLSETEQQIDTATSTEEALDLSTTTQTITSTTQPKRE